MTNEKQHIYFLSDFHLGAPNYAASLEREKKLVRFLDSIKKDAKAVFIVGDIFDFWFEYKHVIPKGFSRFLGKLAELSDAGIELHFFVGNHDMWVKDYFQQEFNMKIYFQPHNFTFNGKVFHIAHGDGLGPGDKGYKLLKKIFRNKLCQWAFGCLHPSWGIGIANFFSKRSRAQTGNADATWLGTDKEWIVLYAKAYQQRFPVDFFICGHRHYPITIDIDNRAQYINLGDWITHFTYAVFDGEKVHLKTWKD